MSYGIIAFTLGVAISIVTTHLRLVFLEHEIERLNRQINMLRCGK